MDSTFMRCFKIKGFQHLAVYVKGLPNYHRPPQTTTDHFKITTDQILSTYYVFSLPQTNFCSFLGFSIPQTSLKLPQTKFYVAF